MSRRARKRRVRGALFIIALAVLIAGFMIRRLILAGAMRNPARSSPSAPGYGNNPNPEGEHITNADRDRLNRLLKDKTGGGR